MAQLLLELAAPPQPTLDNFVAGADGANAAALSALRAFGTPASADRCVYLWGASGSGRSHLLEAWRCLRDSASDSHGGGSAACITQDDVDTLDEAAQIALFNHINAARAGQGYVLAAGRTAPAHLPLRDDLKSRLGWGLTFEIIALSDDDKRAALLHHAQARAMTLTSDVLAYLMTHVRRDMPTLAGIVDALDRFSLETKRPVTLPLVRELLAQNRTLDL